MENVGLMSFLLKGSYFQLKNITLFIVFRECFLPKLPGLASERMDSTWRACALWVLEPMIGRTLPLAQEMAGGFDG